MARNSARSLLAMENRAVAGEKDSQDSQEKLLFLIQEHGIGVVSGAIMHIINPSPVLANDKLTTVRYLNIDHHPTNVQRRASAIDERYKCNFSICLKKITQGQKN